MPVSVETLVVGAGMAGLTAAWRLAKAGRDVLVIDAADAPGGAMRTVARGGFLLEQGPFNVIVRERAFAALLADVAADAPVVPADRAAGRNRYVLFGGRLRKVPSSIADLARTDLLTAAGKARLLRGLAWSRPAKEKGETVAAAARRRFGDEVADRVVSAITVGVYAADSDRLSAAACFPALAEWDRRGHSPIGRAVGGAVGRWRRADAVDRPRGLVSVVGGLGAVPAAVSRRLLEKSRIRLGLSARCVERTNDGFRVTLGSDGEAVACRHLVVAVGASAAGRLLAGVAPAAAVDLARIESSPMAVLNLGYRRQDVGHPLDGYGFLVPRSDAACGLLGVLFADSVFPHHAPPGHRLLRAFVGGTRDPSAIGLGDSQLLARATAALRPILALRGDPVLVDVVRWPDAVPLYAPGHVERSATILRSAVGVPGLHLVGNYLGGVSVNDAVRRGADAADRIAGQS